MKMQDNFGVTADAARAFVPSASSPTVSPVPASIPNVSCETQALIARLEYVIDTTRSQQDRMRSRSHLTNHDLRLCIAALKGYRHD